MHPAPWADATEAHDATLPPLPEAFLAVFIIEIALRTYVCVRDALAIVDMFIVLASFAMLFVTISPEAERATRVSYIETSGPASKYKNVIATILFDNTEKIPEGLYKQLMDALLIKD